MVQRAGQGRDGPPGAAVPVLMVVQNQGVPPDVRIWEFGRTLAGAGYQVDVIAPRRSGQLPQETVDGMRVHRFTEPPEGGGALGYAREIGISLWRVWGTRRRLARSRQLILHFANPPDVLWLPFVRELRAAVVVYDQHDLAPELYLAKGGRPGSVLHRALLGLERSAYAVADLVIVPNGSYRRVALGRGRIAADRVHIVRNAPDESVWTPVAPDPALRRGADIVLCYIGSIGAQDGVDQLLRGLARARTRTPYRRYRCVIAGDGDALPHARLLAAGLGVADCVDFRGWIADQDELRRLVAAADIAVEPCPSNAFNDASTMVKLMNYLALGRPIVAFDLPEHRETTGDAALLVAPNLGADGLGDAIAALAEDDVGRTRLEAAARVRLARAGLTVGDARSSLLQAYAHARALGVKKGYPW